MARERETIDLSFQSCSFNYDMWIMNDGADLIRCEVARTARGGVRAARNVMMVREGKNSPRGAIECERRAASNDLMMLGEEKCLRRASDCQGCT